MTMIVQRRRFMQTAVGVAAAVALPSVRAQSDFPKGPVRIIVPLSAGGAVDTAVRAVSAEFEKQIKQPVIIDNKPGGSFVLGMQALLAAPADGHTLIHLNQGMVAAQVVQKRYDLTKQLMPLTVNGESPMALMVGANSPYKTLKELVEAAKANPGKVSYGTPGIGSGEHLKMSQLEAATGAQFLHVPYKGGPEIIKGVIGGEVDFTYSAAIFAAQFAPKGLVRVLAVFEPNRLKEFPDVPSLTETGVPATPHRVWAGFAAHANTPAPIAQWLHKELSQAILAPSVAEKLSPFGMVLFASKAPDDFRRLIDNDVKWMGDTAKGLKIDTN